MAKIKQYNKSELYQVSFDGGYGYIQPVGHESKIHYNLIYVQTFKEPIKNVSELEGKEYFIVHEKYKNLSAEIKFDNMMRRNENETAKEYKWSDDEPRKFNFEVKCIGKFATPIWNTPRKGLNWTYGWSFKDTSKTK